LGGDAFDGKSLTAKGMLKTKCLIGLHLLLLGLPGRSVAQQEPLPKLQISENRRFFVTEVGNPFFWLGDTAWLLFTKLTREEAQKYFEDRRQKGFNVVQVMVVHDTKSAVNAYGDSALVNCHISHPLTTPGNSPANPEQYDYWDHVDYLISLAQQKGLYLALVPVWGSNIKSGSVSKEEVETYTAWLAERYKDRPNVIWINGGDIKGSVHMDVWNAAGATIKQHSPKQLVTFHPYGRTQSSTWFHNQEWLDFNMFQSGHRSYSQDTVGLHYGEDSWRYVANDYAQTPIKPTIDGEPSYEGIPHGLHDPAQPYWTASDVRRYAYWSVFAGACGFTYGNNAVMQFHKKGDSHPAYGVKDCWEEAINAPGAIQMKYLKQLMLSRPYLGRIPAPDLIARKQGERYDYLAATRGGGYAFIYTCNGNPISVDLRKMDSHRIKASWYNPRTGEYTAIGIYKATSAKTFDPPGEKADGNDWVLVLDCI
jgi:hypothetical protein